MFLMYWAVIVEGRRDIIVCELRAKCHSRQCVSQLLATLATQLQSGRVGEGAGRMTPLDAGKMAPLDAAACPGQPKTSGYIS